MNTTFRKLTDFIVWYLIYYNICFLVLIPEIYGITIYKVAFTLYFLFTFADTMKRPFSGKGEVAKKYSITILIFKLLNPFMLILAFYENKFVISRYFVVWDNLFVYYLGILIFIIGGIIVLMSRIQLGRYGSGLIVIEEEHELVTDGMYRHVRHPIYLGSLLGGFGFEMAFRSLIMPIVILFFYFLIFINRMEKEERILLTEFGEKYKAYLKQTKRLIPFLY